MDVFPLLQPQRRHLTNDNMAPSSQPSAAPHGTEYESLGTPTEQLVYTIQINLFLFAVFCIAFELLRRLKWIYLNRYVTRFIESRRVPDKPSSYPFAWVSKILRVEDQEVLDMIGLDGYMCLRFILVCLRMASFCSVFGALVLVPIYASTSNPPEKDDDTDTGGIALTGWNRFTIANIPEDPTAIRLWAPVVFCYLFTMFFCQMMYAEYKNFIGKRVQYLVRGDSDTPPQAYYTVMVERLPPQVCMYAYAGCSVCIPTNTPVH
jgi:hypothetical protein